MYVCTLRNTLQQISKNDYLKIEIYIKNNSLKSQTRFMCVDQGDLLDIEGKEVTDFLLFFQKTKNIAFSNFFSKAFQWYEKQAKVLTEKIKKY